METENVTSLAKFKCDGTLQTPEDALRDALNDVGNRGALEKGKKILILSLYEGEDGNDYDMSFHQAGMKMSECLALAELSKKLFSELMGY